jgi:hypothetical protein
MKTVKVPEPVVVDRKTIAREHSALFPTRMALARWMSGAHEPDLQSGEGLPLRAAWHAQAQRNFQSWLDHGGFTQYDEPQAGPPAPEGEAHSADVCLD